MSLVLLPLELLCSIIRLLTPIDLISISQVNIHFRAVVKPKKRHFIERLLVLECLPEYGGTTILVYPSSPPLTLTWTLGGWSSMRWACTYCLRLRPHTQFSDPSLFQILYRKPFPGVSDMYAITTWEPPSVKNRAGRNPRIDGMTLRRRRFWATHNGHIPCYKDGLLEAFKDLDMKEFEDMTQHDYDNMTVAEKAILIKENFQADDEARFGYKRHARKCNECRYVFEKFKPKGRGRCGGTDKVPIALSRQVMFPNDFERRFPGLSLSVMPTKPAWGGEVDRSKMYMVRCLRCKTWQESYSFLCNRADKGWTPVEKHDIPAMTRIWEREADGDELCNNLLCHRCVAEEHGTQVLEQALFPFHNNFMQGQQKQLKTYLVKGLLSLYGACVGPAHGAYQADIRQLCERLLPLMFYRDENWEEKIERGEDTSEPRLTQTDVVLMRRQMDQLLELFGRIEKHHPG